MQPDRECSEASERVSSKQALRTRNMFPTIRVSRIGSYSLCGRLSISFVEKIRHHTLAYLVRVYGYKVKYSLLAREDRSGGCHSLVGSDSNIAGIDSKLNACFTRETTSEPIGLL